MLLLSMVLFAEDVRPVSSGIEVPNAIVKQHNAYVRCQDAAFDPKKVTSPASFAAEAERAIVACEQQKLSLKQEAATILGATREYSDQAKRDRALCEAFDSYDELRRAMGNMSQTYKVVCR